ncbi:MAG: hypothetical protein IJ626_00615 [Muribaculaceae bacterium]|nr:hypothetical protein [Muribaculaceae bacterium]
MNMRKTVITALYAVVAVLVAQGQYLPPDSVLRRYAAQMLVVGFRGDVVTDSCDAAHYVRDLKVGGIILFDIDLTGSGKLGSRNVTSPEQLRKMTAKLRSLATSPLIIAADQEGGLVCRLKERYGFSPTVTAKYLGDTDSRDTTVFYSRLLVGDVARGGINLNLAPLLDVHRDDCPPIGHFRRSFSADVDVIARHAEWTIQEHHRDGVMCAVKHFPGHGSATTDSHYGLVDVSGTWQRSELEPYHKLIKKGLVDVVMTAHIYNSNIDPAYPATLSRRTIHDLLRSELGYDGLVITDDLYMEGIIDHYTISQALALAINAGADLILAGNNISTGFEPGRPDFLIDTIVRLVKNGQIPYGRLLESHRRIERFLKRIS